MTSIIASFNDCLHCWAQIAMLIADHLAERTSSRFIYDFFWY